MYKAEDFKPNLEKLTVHIGHLILVPASRSRGENIVGRVRTHIAFPEALSAPYLPPVDLRHPRIRYWRDLA